MPAFTFTKAADNEGDPSVTMTFKTDSLQTLRENLEDFVQAAGFVPEAKGENVVPFERRIDKFDFLAKEDDYMWDDALAAKFSDLDLDKIYAADFVPPSYEYEDIISFDNEDKE